MCKYQHDYKHVSIMNRIRQWGRRITKQVSKLLMVPNLY